MPEMLMEKLRKNKNNALWGEEHYFYTKYVYHKLGEGLTFSWECFVSYGYYIMFISRKP